MNDEQPSDDTRDIRDADDALFARLYAPAATAPSEAGHRIDIALAAYDLSLAEARRPRQPVPRMLTAAAAAAVLVSLGALGGWFAGRGSPAPVASEGVIATVPIRGNATRCPADGEFAGTVALGERTVSIVVRVAPRLTVTLLDAVTCDVIVSLP